MDDRSLRARRACAPIPYSLTCKSGNGIAPVAPFEANDDFSRRLRNEHAARHRRCVLYARYASMTGKSRGLRSGPTAT